MSSEYNYQTIGGRKKSALYALAGTNMSATEEGTDYSSFVEIYMHGKIIGHIDESSDGLIIEGIFEDKTDWNEHGIIEGTKDERLNFTSNEVLLLYRIALDFERDPSSTDKSLWEPYEDIADIKEVKP